MHNSKIAGSSFFPFILYLSVFYSNMLFLCNNFQKPRTKLASCTVKHKPCSHSWKHLVYHEESTVYNILSLWRHEQILLIMLRFKKYLSWDVTSLNICSWRDQLFILGKLKRQLWFLPKEQVFFHRRQFYSFILLKGKTNYTLLFFILHFVSGVLLFIETKD